MLIFLVFGAGWIIVPPMHKPLISNAKRLLASLSPALFCLGLALAVHAQAATKKNATEPIAAQSTPGAPTLSMAAYDRTAAVIFAYQRVGESLYPANSISKEQFANHIKELLEGGYNVMPLPSIIAALKANSPLPERTVAITFNGGYESALDNAIPLLLNNNLPFTVFFSPDQPDSKNPEYMGWDDIKRLKKYNQVTLGLHPASYTRLTENSPNDIRRQVNNALTRYRQILKTEPRFFAYPFGEYTKEFRDIVASSGFEAALGQQSGVAYTGSDMYVLPRFAMTESYGDDARFRMAATALPLPVTDITPDDPYITTNNPPTIGFTIEPALASKIPQLSCFLSGHGKPDMQVVGNNRVELRVDAPFQAERIRVNCTMPGPEPKPGEEARWRWFGMLLSVDLPGEGREDYATGDYDESTVPPGPLPN